MLNFKNCCKIHIEVYQSLHPDNRGHQVSVANSTLCPSNYAKFVVCSVSSRYYSKMYFRVIVFVSFLFLVVPNNQDKVYRRNNPSLASLTVVEAQYATALKALGVKTFWLDLCIKH